MKILSNGMPMELTLTPHIAIRSTFPLLRRSNIVRATTPAPLSLSAAVPPTYPVVYSPVPTINTFTFVCVIVEMLLLSQLTLRAVMQGSLCIEVKCVSVVGCCNSSNSGRKMNNYTLEEKVRKRSSWFRGNRDR